MNQIEHNMSTRQMILDIYSMKRNAMSLLKSKSEYNGLLQYLIDNDFYVEYNDLPAIKDICKDTGLSYSKLRKHLDNIYNELLFGRDGECVCPFTFNRVVYRFVVKGREKERSAYFETDHLPFIPRIGENVDIPFFRAYLETHWFYVAEIQHQFTEDTQEIIIYLKPGRYNLYWHWRKDKAEEENELFWQDFIHLEDYELKHKLRIGNWR